MTLADGVVTLRGIVLSDTDRTYAEQLAATAAGSDATIDNQLTVSRP